MPVGAVEKEALFALKEGLARTLSKTTAKILDNPLPLSEEYLDKNRWQYRSSQLLDTIQSYTPTECLNRILGVVEADIFVPGLNFVFGEATFPGHAALVSLCRLRPEFYGESANNQVLNGRLLKEAVHEIGHTIGLRHCHKSSCVMHFSNSISDTDQKQSLFCKDCYLASTIFHCLEWIH